MIKLESLSKSFGAEDLFEDITWHLPPATVVGLVGPNGAGKTTLFRILAGELEPDDGRVVVPRDCNVGYLPQELTEEGSGTLLDVVLDGARDVLEMEDELESLQQQLEGASGDDTVELSNRYSELQEEYRKRGGYQIRSRAREIAVGLGFSTDEFDRSIETFSGGWRMRAVLGRLLLSDPDLLLLDEPTNHLDLESLEWLEGYLANYDGTVITISHDRYFLNRLAERIVELSAQSLHVFEGNYDTYREKRREWRENLKKKAEEQQKEIDRIQEFIDKFRYNASKASLVQSRIKKLERMDRVEVPEPITSDVHFEFPQPPRIGKMALSVEDLSKSYGDNVVYDSLDMKLYRGQKVAFVGPNGAGKSTLMKMIAGRLEPDSGSVEYGNRVKVSYFAQHSADQFDLDDTVFEAMEANASPEAYPRIRNVLGAFGFSDLAVDKKVGVLSGGEKSRLALANMLLEPAGCLLLDEPTNHLDIPSRQMLEQALTDFEGVVCVISHDRYFLNRVVNRVVHIEDGGVTNYRGDYDYYRYKRGEDEAAADLEDDGAAKEAGDGGAVKSRKERRRVRAKLRKERNAETRELQNEIAEIEEAIEDLEERQEELEEELADPETYDNPDKLEKLNREYDAVQGELLEKMEAWEEKGAQLEEIDQEYAERESEILGD